MAKAAAQMAWAEAASEITQPPKTEAREITVPHTSKHTLLQGSTLLRTMSQAATPPNNNNDNNNENNY